VDLATGKISTPFGTDRLLMFFSGPAGSYYLEFYYENPARESDSIPDAFMIGRFDSEKEELHPFDAHFVCADCKLAWAVGQAHFAIAMSIPEHHLRQLMIFDAKGALMKRIGIPGLEISQVAFGPDDRRVYPGRAIVDALVLTVIDVEKGVIEAETREQFAKLGEDDFTFASSPNGSQLVITNQEQGEADAYLIDLTKTNLVVTHIHVPR
jgi:hypothetical protein